MVDANAMTLIERRMALLDVVAYGMLPEAAANAATREVAANMALLSSVSDRHFCALSIWEGAKLQPKFKASLVQFEPALWAEAEAAQLENVRRETAKEVRKGVEAARLLRDAINVAKAMTPAQAVLAARTDMKELQPLILEGEETFLVSAMLGDMALKCENSEAYAEAVSREFPAAGSLLAKQVAPKFLAMDFEVPMQSMSGCKMVYNGAAGMAGAEVLLPDGARLCFGGREAIDAFALEKSLSQADYECLIQLDALVDIHELRVPEPQISVGVEAMDTQVTHPEIASLKLPESCANFLSLLAQSKKAALDVNVETGQSICMRSDNYSTGAQGDGVVPVSYGNAWQRVASCEGAVLSLDERQLAGVFKVAPLVMGAMVDYKGITSLVTKQTLKSDFSIARQDDGAQHCGEVTALSVFFAVQSAGRGKFVLHELSALDQVPEQGHSIEIKYKNRVGEVLDKTRERDQAVMER